MLDSAILFRRLGAQICFVNIRRGLVSLNRYKLQITSSNSRPLNWLRKRVVSFTF